MDMKLPLLFTPRLLLREIEEKDCLDMYEYAHLSYVGPTAGWKPHSSPNETKAIIRMFIDKKKLGQLGTYAIIWQQTNKMIGTVELHTYIKNFKAELGYTVNPLYWGRGIAVEASKKVISLGFEVLKLRRIECASFVSNTQSRRVCEKLGLSFEGIRKKGYLNYDGSIHDINCYAITDDEYFQRLYNNEW
ncbi:MAG: GNAT family N-acetyltransferase [Bacilli bacterium]|nr:GNAT family N-acetyltransferase [Bacilli bacterium]MDD4076518.1 GNAT family protein [Bacilli bacterium]MDD4387725.1 GNAT family protein [Bacilli bacterium]